MDPRRCPARGQLPAGEKCFFASNRNWNLTKCCTIQPFDVALDPNPVYTLATPFIKSCPSSNPTLPFKAFPMLMASPLNNGQTTLSYEGGDFNGKTAIFLTATGQKSVPVNGDGTVAVPEGLYGQQYIILASQDAELSDDIVVAGPAVLEVPLQATEFTDF